MNTTPTQQPAPDHGEPWQLTTDFAFDITIRGELAASFDKIEHANRAVSCVNACAGIADPAKEIAALKQVGIANATMHLEAVDAAAEIAAMREAIREAFEHLCNVGSGRGCLLGFSLDDAMPDIEAATDKLQSFTTP